MFDFGSGRNFLANLDTSGVSAGVLKRAIASTDSRPTRRKVGAIEA